MALETILRRESLALAWERILRSSSVPYKKHFRTVYDAFEVAKNRNLDRLASGLQSGLWEPSPPTKVYTPKASGLQRTFSLLHVEDQIVFQAMADYCANRLRNRRKRLEGKVVFSNLLTSQKNKFFLLPWKTGYRQYNRTTRFHVGRGNKVVANFDLASFYDTISHDLLIARIAPLGGGQYEMAFLRKCLETWAGDHDDSGQRHGIPQGLSASDFFAEALLVPLDESMARSGTKYIRYVDDIRIFAKSQTAARTAVVKLEILTKKLGLIAQGSKHSIRTIETAGQLADLTISIPDQDDLANELIVKAKAAKAEAIFSDAIAGRPLRIVDKTKAKYALNRCPPSAKMLSWTIRLLPRHPEFIDSFSSFMGGYETSKLLERELARLLLENPPYDYLRGILWQHLARFADKTTLRVLRPLAREEIAKTDRNSFARIGAILFLLQCQANGLGKVSGRIARQGPLVQVGLVSELPEIWFDDKGLIGSLLRSKHWEVSAPLAFPLIRLNRDHTYYGIRADELAEVTRDCYRALGLVRGSPQDVDSVGKIISRRYGAPTSDRWRAVLGKEYRHAVLSLRVSEVQYESNVNGWLRSINSFNDVLTRAIIRKLCAKGLVGCMPLKNNQGQLEDYGRLLLASKPFGQTFVGIASNFRIVNSRRNAIPDSHPYEKRTGRRTKYLTRRTRGPLWNNLAQGYASVVPILAKLK